MPPKEVTPDPMLVPTYCEYWSRSQFHPITDERNDNAKCRKELAAWIAAAKETTLFSYYGDDCIKRFVYNPLIDVVTADVRTYRQMGLAGHFVLLTNPESWWSNAPHLYAYARAAWNPDIEVGRIERDYYEALYGPAAPAMRAHAAACRALFDLKTAQGGTGEDVLWGVSFPAWDPAKDAETVRQFTDAVGRVRAALRQARAAKPDAWVLERVRKLDADADYVEMLAQLACEMQRVVLEKTPQAQARLLKLAERGLRLEVVDEDDRRGYRSARNLLIDTARRLAGKELDIPRGDPAARKEFVRRGVWMWKSDDINPSSREKPRRVVIEVTDRVKAAGDYEAVWDYLEGDDGVSLISVGLYSTGSRAKQPDDLQPEVVDTHGGFTGGGDSENVYTLPLKEYRPGRRYFLVSLVYNQREFDTYGQVLFSRKE